MGSRAIGEATIQFGLVACPVKIYAAVDTSESVAFNLLHNKCNGRVKQQYICPKDGNAVVSRDEMVKGYEFSKDQYVVFTQTELDALDAESTHTIAVEEFIPIDKIDSMYFDKPYYLGPGKGGEKAYWLLAEALRQTNRGGLATWQARGKQYLVLIRALEMGLAMQQLLYADEVRAFDEIGIGTKGVVNDDELKLAKRLVVEQGCQAFHPEDYKDDVHERIQEQIAKKVKGGTIEVKKGGETINITDLSDALRKSLGRPKKVKVQLKKVAVGGRK